MYKKMGFLLIGYIMSVWFYGTRLIYWLLNLLLVKKDRHRVPPTREKLLLTSASKLAESIRNLEISSEEVVMAYIERIRVINPIINSVVQDSFEEAVRKARDIDDKLQSGYNVDVDSQPLLGVPFTLKDCIMVKGSVCSAGMVNRKNAMSTIDADVVRRMKNAGAIQLCVTNVSEVCMWWESANKLYGRTRNPCIVGGSSGGEGALLASCGSVIGLGSDIGGSLRMPALFNGIFTIKPSSHVVPDDGIIPECHGYQHQMHSIGPMCRYAVDLMPMLKVLAKEEQLDRLELHKPVDLKQIKVYYMEGMVTPAITPLSKDMKSALINTVKYFETRHDCKCIRLDLPLMHHMVPSFLTDLSDIPDGLRRSFSSEMLDGKGAIHPEKETLKLMTIGSDHTAPALLLALLDKYDPLTSEQVKATLKSRRQKLQDQVKQLLGDDGVLLFPTHPTSAPYHTQPLVQPFNYMYTGVFNSLCLPAAHCPTGLNSAGLPIGLQVIANDGMDRLCIAFAREIEMAFGGWRAPSA